MSMESVSNIDDEDTIMKEEKMRIIAAEWKEEHENILKEWAEKAMCYRWLHHKSHISYRKMNALFTIPVIVISTLTGTANFALERFSPSAQQWAVMVIGALNISAGIISTVSQFLKISEINEGHRVASVSWDKFYRNIKLEINKAPKERRHPLEMLKLSQEEYDRLIETSPMIHDKIINQFKKSFDFKKIKDELSLPEILDDLEEVSKYDRKKHKDEIVKYEIRNEDIIDKLQEVMAENNENPLEPININNITNTLKDKLQKEVDTYGKVKKDLKTKDNEDFIIEMKPQLKYKNKEKYIKSPPSRISNKNINTHPSFMIGAHAVRINELENTLEAASSDSDNSIHSPSDNRNNTKKNDNKSNNKSNNKDKKLKNDIVEP
jgi:hypothetical protein